MRSLVFFFWSSYSAKRANNNGDDIEIDHFAEYSPSNLDHKSQTCKKKKDKIHMDLSNQYLVLYFQIDHVQEEGKP